MIISASRRCDIPAYFGQWMLNRLQAGYVLIQNPYNAHRYSKALLNRQAVDIIVFWTKNPLPFRPYWAEIEAMGYPFYFEFTITPYGQETEANLPAKELLIAEFIKLADKLGPKRLVWRYDPIIIDDLYDINYHRRQFLAMAKQLKGSTERCVISFVDDYKHLGKRIGQENNYRMTLENIYQLSEILAEIAQGQGLELYTCAEQINLAKYGIRHGACLDQGIIEAILGYKIKAAKDKNQRPECLCLNSIDIGTYNCCANGCNYCYALKSPQLALANIKRHNPQAAVLIGEINPDALITERESKTVIINQLSLFD